MIEDELPSRDPVGSELRGRAAAGAALLGARGALIFTIGIVANVALARLLAPRDFGIFALGMVIVVAGGFLAEGGLGGALVKRREPPERVELEAVAALQISVTTAIAFVLGIAAVPLGRDVELMAIMAVSLPIATLRAPSMIVLERRLEYPLIASADLVEALVFYGAAIVAVALGMGAWGLAIAVVLRAAAGSLTMIVAGPVGLMRPSWSWPDVHPLLGFGAKLQAGSLIAVGREQLLNVGVGAVAGLGTLGVWTLAWRVMQIPALLFQTVGRVGFPTMARLLAAEIDPRPVIERQVAAVAAVNAISVVALVGFAPALPAIVGDDWREVPRVLLWSGSALILAAPVVVSAAGFLLAAGMPGVVAVATAVSGVVWIAVALPLLAPLGAEAVGIAWIASGCVNAVLLWRPVAARTSARIIVRIAPGTASALAAAAAAWFVAHEPDEQLVGGIAGLVVGELIVFAGLVLFSRPALRDVVALARDGLRSFRPAAR